MAHGKRRRPGKAPSVRAPSVGTPPVRPTAQTNAAPATAAEPEWVPVQSRRAAEALARGDAKAVEIAERAAVVGSDLDRFLACCHEAAHAVISYRVGLRIGRWGVQVGDPDSPRRFALAHSETLAGGMPDHRRATATQLAGPLYEAVLLGQRITDADLLAAIAQARSDGDVRTDHAAIFARHLASEPRASDDAMLAAYRAAEAEVLGLLRDPATMRSIAALARALVWHQRLPTDMVERLIEPGALTAAPAFAVSLAEVFERDVPVFLGFSGGRDSIALADLCAPWRERVTLLWVNTGLMAPHMVEFVRGYRERGWRLVELASQDMLAFWRDYGIPADVTSASHAMGWEGQAYQLWTSCCFANRQLPANQFLAAQGRCIYLTGQRRGDRGGTPHGIASTLPDAVDVVMPLWDWSTDQVQEHVNRERLILPPQYAEGLADSIECLSCPAAIQPERMRYLEGRYPETAERVRPVIQRALAEAARRIIEVRAATGT